MHTYLVTAIVSQVELKERERIQLPMTLARMKKGIEMCQNRYRKTIDPLGLHLGVHRRASFRSGEIHGGVQLQENLLEPMTNTYHRASPVSTNADTSLLSLDRSRIKWDIGRPAVIGHY